MNSSSITNAQIHYAKQLLAGYIDLSLPLDKPLLEQCLYSQFKMVIHALINEVGDSYHLSTGKIDQSVTQKIKTLVKQTDGMAELAILTELIESNNDNFLNKILNYQLSSDTLANNDSIFTTVNTEKEILNELTSLIQTIRGLSIQQ